MINSENGMFRLNNISTLNRWTKSAIGEDVDALYIEFDSINHVDFHHPSYAIKSRDLNGIIDECENATKSFLEDVSKTLIDNLKNVYINCN